MKENFTASHSFTPIEREFHRVFAALTEGSRGILLGYSGGADSTALLHLLRGECTRRGMYLAAVHINHGIRGAEADRDEAHCKAVCESLKVDFHVLHADIPALARECRKSIEETARDFRYETFARICEDDARLDTVATAHNADDNAETLIFNLARGTGIAGLSGIPTERPLGNYRVIRPLLFASKREIVAYCDTIGADYIFDSTNADTKYTRNFIRSELIPRLTELNPAFLSSAQRLTASAREDSELLESLASEFLRANTREGRLATDPLAKAPKPIAKRAIRLAYEAFFTESIKQTAPTLEAVHIDSLLALCKSGGELSLPGKLTASVRRGELEFTREKKHEATPFRFEIKSGPNLCEGGNFAIFAIFPGDDAELAKKDNEKLKNIYKLFITARLKSDIIKDVLFARSKIPGDRIVSGGMTRRLKVLFNGAGLSELERSSLPLICDGDGILWIPGIALADRANSGDNDATVTLYYYSNRKANINEVQNEH